MFRRAPRGRKKKFKIALALIYEGYHEKTWKDTFNEAPVTVLGKALMDGGKLVLRSDIPQYLDGDFFAAYMLWQRVKRFGLPSGEGWLNEAGSVLQLVEYMDGELLKLENAAMEKRKKDAGNKRIARPSRGRNR